MGFSWVILIFTYFCNFTYYQEWFPFFNQFKYDRYITSDCDAVQVMHDNHKYAKTPEDAAAFALKAGMVVPWKTVLLRMLSTFFIRQIKKTKIEAQQSHVPFNYLLNKLIKFVFGTNRYFTKENLKTIHVLSGLYWAYVGNYWRCGLAIYLGPE